MEQILYAWRDQGIAIDRIRREGGFNMPVKHLHNEYEIYYLLEGERYYFIDSQTYHVKKGGLVLIDKNQIHQTSQAGTESHERILISLEEQALGPFFMMTGEFSLSPFFENHWGVLQLGEEEQSMAEAAFSRLAQEIEEKKAGSRHMILSILSCFLIHIYRSLPTRSAPAAKNFLSTASKHRKVDEVASYITVHYREALSLEALADHFYVSKCYLSRIFKEATGFTVVEYLNMCRIKEARRLLMSGSMSITEISDLLGYDTITYFERVFKKYTQTSPLKYRKAYEHRVEPASGAVKG